MNILLLSAYDAVSHRAWHEGLVRSLPEHSWRVLTLPARYFSWRIRGNSLTWAFDDALHSAGDYDCVLATSMTDLSALRGMCPALCRLPTLLYFHENQFFYPRSLQQHQSLEPQIVQLYAALSADRLAFNSEHNRLTFLDGVSAVLKKMPDCVPKNVLSILKNKSCCLPVGLDLPGVGVRSIQRDNFVSVVWNHRWEYDKGPERLLKSLQKLPENLPLRFHVVGQQFRSRPVEFERIKAILIERGWLGEWGFIESSTRYYELLSHSDIVLSTAHHDFQGLSVMEAVMYGCVPVVPDALAYPQWIPDSYRYSIDSDDVANLCSLLQGLTKSIGKKEGALPKPDLQELTWSRLKNEYRRVLGGLVGQGLQAQPMS